MSHNILEQFSLIKNIIKINHNDEVFASLIYGDGFNEAMVPYYLYRHIDRSRSRTYIS